MASKGITCPRKMNMLDFKNLKEKQNQSLPFSQIWKTF